MNNCREGYSLGDKGNRVIKHSSTIQIDHSHISLMQQQLWNVLLANAFPQFEKRDRDFKIAVKELEKYIPGVTNRAHMKKILRQLVATPVECNIFDKDKDDHWICFALLSSVEIKNGDCVYNYDHRLQTLLNNPSVYSKINLLIQQNYKGGKYGWFLYELCFDYKDIGKTPMFSLESAKKFFGIKEGTHTEYKNFNRYVLKPAITEVNRQTDLIIELNKIKTGRKITHIQFVIKHKTSKTLEYKEEPRKDESASKAIQALEEFCVSKAGIRAIAEKYNSSEILEAIEAARDFEKDLRERKGEDIKYPDTVINKALEKGWKSKAAQRAREREEEDAKQKERLEEQEAYQNLHLKLKEKNLEKWEEEDARLKEEEKQAAAEYAAADGHGRFHKVWAKLPQKDLDALPEESLDALQIEIEKILPDCDTFEQAASKSLNLLLNNLREIEDAKARKEGLAKIQKALNGG